MEPGKLTGTYDKDYFRRVSRNLSTDKVPKAELSASLQNKVDLLMTKIDNLESIYNQHIPKIMENLDTLNKKMDFIYKKMVGDSTQNQ
jgi:tetrahydromethanopterin S-methyltransferase subunit G